MKTLSRHVTFCAFHNATIATSFLECDRVLVACLGGSSLLLSSGLTVSSILSFRDDTKCWADHRNGAACFFSSATRSSRTALFEPSNGQGQYAISSKP